MLHVAHVAFWQHFQLPLSVASCLFQLPVAVAVALPRQTLWLESLVFTQEWNLLQFSFYLFVFLVVFLAVDVVVVVVVFSVSFPFPILFHCCPLGTKTFHMPSPVVLSCDSIWPSRVQVATLSALCFFLWISESPTVSHVPSRVRRAAFSLRSELESDSNHTILMK